MSTKKDLKDFFNKVLGVSIEIQGEDPTPEVLDKKNFITFVDSYKKAVKRSMEVDDKHNLNLWEWNNLYAQSLEGLIYFTFDEYIAEVILWFIYEHDLVEDESDWVITDPEENQHLIKTSEDLYELVLKLEKM
jgi:hypothetical protein